MRLLTAVLLVSLVWLYARPFLDTHPEQDACIFGAISNERYRELLAEAKLRQVSIWPGLSGSPEAMNLNLTQRVQDLTSGMTSLEERIAAMHAVARALGAEYRVAAFDKEDPYLDRHGRFPPQNIRFHYVLDVHRIGGFSPFLRFADVFFGFDAHAPPDVAARLGFRTNTFHASILWPNVYDGMSIPPRSRRHPNCPPVPSPEWQRTYEAWLKTQPEGRP